MRSSNEEIYLSMGISKTVYDYGCTIEKSLRDRFDEVADKPPVGYMITVDPNTNLLYTKTKIPAVKYHIRKGSQEIVTRVDAEVI